MCNRSGQVAVVVTLVTPKGLHPKAQGCVLATLGSTVACKGTPKGPKGFHLTRRR